MSDSKQLTANVSKPKSRRWVVFAAMAGLFFGIGNIVFSYELVSYGMLGACCTDPLILVLFTLYKLFIQYKVKRDTGYVIDRTNSNWFDNKTLQFKKSNFIYLSIAAFSGFCVGVLSAYSFNYANYAEINVGIIPSLYAIGSFYTAVSFYFAFGQTVSKINICGMLLMVVCIVLLSIDINNNYDKNDTSVATSSQSNIRVSQRTAAFLAIFIGIITPSFFTTRGTAVRFAQSRGYKSFDLIIDGMLVEALIKAVLLIIFSNDNLNTFKPITTSVLVQGMFVGVFNSLGKLFIGLAYVEGVGGPANTICNTQIIYQVLWNAIAWGQSMTPMQIFGVVLGMSSAFICSMGDLIYSKFKQQSKGQKEEQINSSPDDDGKEQMLKDLSNKQ